jgi:hypothetical protein
MHRVRFYIGTTRTAENDPQDGPGTWQAPVFPTQWGKAEALLLSHWDGFTRYDAEGAWKHEGATTREPSRVYEVLDPDDYLADALLISVAQALGVYTGQAAVYYTRDEVRGGLVFSAQERDTAPARREPRQRVQTERETAWRSDGIPPRESLSWGTPSQEGEE